MVRHPPALAISPQLARSCLDDCRRIRRIVPRLAAQRSVVITTLPADVSQQAASNAISDCAAETTAPQTRHDPPWLEFDADTPAVLIAIVWRGFLPKPCVCYPMIMRTSLRSPSWFVLRSRCSIRQARPRRPINRPTAFGSVPEKDLLEDLQTARRSTSQFRVPFAEWYAPATERVTSRGTGLRFISPHRN